MEFFHEIESCDENKVYLIDTSGSTSNMYNDEYKTVLDRMIKIVKDDMENMTTANIILWSDKAEFYSNVKLDDKTFNEKINSNGDTQLNIALTLLLDIIDENKFTTIEIITDGQINDKESTIINSLSTLANKMSTNKFKIIIKTCSNNDVNYYNEFQNCASRLFKIIYDNDFSQYVNKYILYNKSNEDGFINLRNEKLNEGFIQYDDKCFLITDLPLFMVYIKEIIRDINLTNKLSENWREFNIYHELIDKGIEKFASDWNSLII